jgi:hypothetical protein
MVIITRFTNHPSIPVLMSHSGTGEVIRGHALGAGDRGRGHGNGKAIAAAGREEVERGLDKLEGKRIRTSTTAGVAPTGQDPNPPQTSTATVDSRANLSAEKAGEEGSADPRGYPADRGTTAGIAPTGRDPNAPQTSTAATVDPRAGPSAEKVREEGPADAGGYPADRRTTASSGAVGGDDVPGRWPDEYRDEQAGSHAVTRDHPQAAAAAATRNGPGGQREADVEPRTTSGDPDEQTRDVANVP